jgi:hypothetical protein
MILMKTDKSIPAVLSGTLYLGIYLFLLSVPVMQRYAVLLFSLSPFMLIAMVLIVLKYGKPSHKTFDSHFYEDID